MLTARNTLFSSPGVRTLQYVLSRPLATTLYCDPASANAKIVFEKMQVQFASTPQDANVLWMRRGYTDALQNLAPIKPSIISPTSAH